MNSRCGHIIKLKVFANPAELTEALARLLQDAIGAAQETPYAVMLSGGATPMAAYARLAQSAKPAPTNLQLIFSDDRYVPADSPKSNYGHVRPLIQALTLPDDRVIRVASELPIEEATQKFGQDVQSFFDKGGVIPLGLLGLGADGHTASLFSSNHIEQGRGRNAIAVHRPDGMDGVSLTPAVFARIKRIVILAAGPEKRVMLGRLLKESLSIPAGMAVADCKSVEAWCDVDANPL